MLLLNEFFVLTLILGILFRIFVYACGIKWPYVLFKQFSYFGFYFFVSVLVVALEKVERSSGSLIGSSIASIQKSTAPEVTFDTLKII